MNERIKELSEQAANEIADLFVTGFFDDRMVSDVAEIINKKFAELIVIECASICYNSGLKDSDAHAMNLMFDFNIDNCRNDK